MKRLVHLVGLVWLAAALMPGCDCGRYDARLDELCDALCALADGGLPVGGSGGAGGGGSAGGSACLSRGRDCGSAPMACCAPLVCAGDVSPRCAPAAGGGASGGGLDSGGGVAGGGMSAGGAAGGASVGGGASGGVAAGGGTALGGGSAGGAGGSAGGGVPVGGGSALGGGGALGGGSAGGGGALGGGSAGGGGLVGGGMSAGGGFFVPVAGGGAVLFEDGGVCACAMGRVCCQRVAACALEDLSTCTIGNDCCSGCCEQGACRPQPPGAPCAE